MNDMTNKTPIPSSLRVGYVSDLYTSIAGIRPKNQLDMLYFWFGELFITASPSEGQGKTPPEYSDVERRIYAKEYKGSLYGTGSPRVTHLIGRLCGTSDSNRDKERVSAELIQKRVSSRLCKEREPLDHFLSEVEKRVVSLNEAEQEQFYEVLVEYCVECAVSYETKSEYEREEELFPMDEEVNEQVLYNAFYQLCRYEETGLVNAYAWLLLGSLLRNECGRLARIYDSSFVPLFRNPSETGTLLDKMNYLVHPEAYEPVYYGEDTGERMPDIKWYCDQCGDRLDLQEGFDDHLSEWKCLCCGTMNRIDPEEVYDSEEDFRHGIHRQEPEQLMEVIANVKKSAGNSGI